VFGKTDSFAILAAALLFGRMTLHFFALPPFYSKHCQRLRLALRLAFPWFYLFVLAASALAALNPMNACVFMTATVPE
jgi:hypothetical protein